jgi:N6-L-threonylcarbamoyladenine synthase
VEQTGLKQLVVAGGVSANRYLRQRLHELAEKRRFEVFFPAPAYCTDNGAMIAFAGAQRLATTSPTQRQINVRPRWPMGELNTKY